MAWHVVRAFAGPSSPVPTDWLEDSEIGSEEEWWQSTERRMTELLEGKVVKEAAAEVEELEQQLAQAKAKLTAATVAK